VGSAEGVLLFAPDGDAGRVGAPLALPREDKDSVAVLESDGDGAPEAEPEREVRSLALGKLLTEGEPLRLKVRVAACVREPVAEGVVDADAHALARPLRVTLSEALPREVRLGEPLLDASRECLAVADALRMLLALSKGDLLALELPVNAAVRVSVGDRVSVRVLRGVAECEADREGRAVGEREIVPLEERLTEDDTVRLAPDVAERRGDAEDVEDGSAPGTPAAARGARGGGATTIETGAVAAMRPSDKRRSSCVQERGDIFAFFSEVEVNLKGPGGACQWTRRSATPRPCVPLVPEGFPILHIGQHPLGIPFFFFF
jgi:hypothetical protein